jgi:hypothetical protein
MFEVRHAHTEQNKILFGSSMPEDTDAPALRTQD